MPVPMHFNNSRTPRAFTLLELLVAMAVLSILLVLLISVTNSASKLWRANENRVDSYREARAAINMISGDLSSLFSSTNTAFFAVTPEDGRQDADLPPVKTGTPDEGMNGKIFFLTALPIDAQGENRNSNPNKSDLCTIGYYLAYDKTSLTGKGTASYNLYRYFRGSDATFAQLSQGNPFADIDIQVTDTSPTTSQGAEVIAKNITGFEIKPYTVDTSATATANSAKPFQKFQKSAKTPLPDIIEIKIKAIDNESAKRFGDKEAAWKDTGSITRKQAERIFTTRVYLPSAAQVKNPNATQ